MEKDLLVQFLPCIRWRRKCPALESVYNNMDLNFINWNQIRQIVYVESRSALHTLLLRTDYLGVGILPSLDQEKIIISYPFRLPDSIIAEKGRSNYICSYIFPQRKGASPRLPGHTLPFWNNVLWAEF